MCGVGPGFPAARERAPVPGGGEGSIRHPLSCVPFRSAGPGTPKTPRSRPGIAHFQPEGELEVGADPHCLRGLPVGEAFPELQHQHWAVSDRTGDQLSVPSRRAPLPHAAHHWRQRPALTGQKVADSGRPGWGAVAFDDTRTGQLRQPVRENLVREGGQGGGQLGVCGLTAAQEFAEYERRPSAAQRGEGDVDGASRFVARRNEGAGRTVRQRTILITRRRVSNRLVSHEGSF